MKTLLLLAAVCVTSFLPVSGALLFNETFNSGFENSGNIPDGSVNPWSDTRTLSGVGDAWITGVNVRLNIAGGMTGDLYCYLSYGGVMVPLLNRVGVGSGNSFGYSDAGLNVTFTTTAANNIHFYQSVSGYMITSGAMWQPDGRTINPVTSLPSAFDAPGTETLGRFNGLNPYGDWTLVIGDVVSGGGQAQVLSWGLEIQAVPEPVNVALGIFAVVFVFGEIVRQQLRRAGTPARGVDK